MAEAAAEGTEAADAATEAAGVPAGEDEVLLAHAASRNPIVINVRLMRRAMATRTSRVATVS